ncbi:unnamed protein product [Mucor hiemalis]
MVGELMFQHEDLRQQELARRANAIVEQALTPGSVLFSFPAGTFASRTEAYNIIEANIGVTDGFRCLNLYQRKFTGGLLIEAKFVSPLDATKAVVSGFAHKGKVFRGALSEDKSIREGMVHVKLNLLRIPDKATFLADLQSLCAFMVKRYTCGGYFEGQVSVILDTLADYKNASGEDVKCQPLERMLYLSAWDTFASATFKGAKKVCNFCRKVGHVVKQCPELAKLVCYNCGKSGHTAGRCKVVKSDSDLLDEYVELSNKVAPKVHVTDTVLPSAQVQESEVVVVSSDTGIDGEMSKTKIKYKSFFKNIQNNRDISHGVASKGTDPIVEVESKSDESDSLNEVSSIEVEDEEDLPEAVNDEEYEDYDEDIEEAGPLKEFKPEDDEILLLRPGIKKIKTAAAKKPLDKKNIYSSNPMSRTVMKKAPVAISKSTARRA